MATYTIITPINIDTLVAKTGADTYNINGGYLTIDQHSRYGVNQNTSATLGNITANATLGGTIELNATKIRLITYDTGTGLVPALDTLITQGSASGKLLGVYANLTSAPVTAGGAMPTSGYILIRQRNDISYTAGALGGISANSVGADNVGWLEIVASDTLTLTASGLNKILMYGEYYDFLGATTSGSRATGYQVPNNGSNMYIPSIEVESDIPGIYDVYPNAGSRTALDTNIATDELRGKFCWVTTSGLIRFGSDGTNSTGGYCPPAGRKIRMGNLILQNASTGAPTVNAIPNATLASRYELNVTGGSYVDMDKVSCNWYLNLNQAFFVRATNVSTFDNFTLTECSSPIQIYNVSVGQSAALLNFGLVLTNIFAGGVMHKCTRTRSALSAAGNYIKSIAFCNNITFSSERNHQIGGNRGNATSGSMSASYMSNCVWNDCLLACGKNLLASSNNLTFTNSQYYDHPATTTPNVNSQYMFELTYSNNVKVDGVNFGGLRMVQPYNGILSSTSFSSGTILRNLGTYDSPLELGDVRQDDVTRTRVTTTATVTKVGHGLKVGDRFFVPVSSNATAITVTTSKVVLAVPTADTFTFTCVNSGTTSGTLSYFPTMSSYLFVMNTSSSNMLVQRCYVPHTATNLYSLDNSNNNIRIDNVISDYLNAFTTPGLNMTIRSVSGNPTVAPQAACYGTHRLDAYNADVTTNLTNLSWSRVTTVCTVTCPDHKLRSGLFINVVTSDNKAGVPLGTKTITVLDSNTFTFTCVNSGTTSGLLDIRTVVDRIALMMNAPTTQTADQISNIVGTTAFTNGGGLAMSTISDSITFESPSYRYGFTGFPAVLPVMGGGTISNYRIEYQLDKNDGSGYGGRHNMYYREVTGSGGGAGTFTFTVTDASLIEVGNYVIGTNIGGLAKVTDITGTTITVDEPNIGTVSGLITFYAHQRNEVLSGNGFKFKIKITTIATNTTAITSLSIYGDSTDDSRKRLYPLDTANATFSFSGLVTGTEVVMFDASNNELDREVIAGTTYSYNYEWNSDDGDTTGYALIWKDDKQPIKFEDIVLSDETLNVPISQVDDLIYNGTYTSVSTIDYTNKLQILTTQSVSIPVLYSERKDNIRLTNNAQYDFAYRIVGGNVVVGATSIPDYVFQINGRKIRPIEANGTTNMIDGIIVAESGDPFVNTLGAYTVRINYQNPVQALTVSTSGGTLTASDVWSYNINTHNVTNSTGNGLKTINQGIQKASLIIPHTENI